MFDNLQNAEIISTLTKEFNEVGNQKTSNHLFFYIKMMVDVRAELLVSACFSVGVNHIISTHF